MTLMSAFFFLARLNCTRKPQVQIRDYDKVTQAPASALGAVFDGLRGFHITYVHNSFSTC